MIYFDNSYIKNAITLYLIFILAIILYKPNLINDSKNKTLLTIYIIIFSIISYYIFSVINYYNL
jgi:hypothetical protein